MSKKASVAEIFDKEFENLDQVIEEQYKEIRQEEGKASLSNSTISDSNSEDLDFSKSDEEIEEIIAYFNLIY